jgi:hypothetical protein
MKSYLGLALSLFASATLCCSGQITIGTLGDWNGTSSSSLEFGNDPSATSASTWGQTFTVPIGNPLLTDFSINLLDITPFDPTPLVFDGYLMKWNGTQATGPILYDSGAITLGTGFTWHQVAFNSLNLHLNEGQQYVFFVSTSAYANGPEGAADVGSMLFSSYTGGVEVNMNNGANLSAWTTQAWDQGSLALGNDIAFQADFVPEPSLASLLTLGFGVLLLVRWTKEKAEA